MVFMRNKKIIECPLSNGSAELKYKEWCSNFCRGNWTP